MPLLRPFRSVLAVTLSTAVALSAGLVTAASPAGAAPSAVAPTDPDTGSTSRLDRVNRLDRLDGEVVASPDGSIETTVAVVGGRLTYEVVRDQTTSVVAPSGLGFRLGQPAIDLTQGLRIDSVERAVVDETWTPAWGTSSSVRNHASELTVHAVHEASGVELDVVFRVFDDGVGFRYHFPAQPALGARFTVAAESTQFTLPADLTAYYIAAGRDWNADEKHYQTVPLPQVPTAQTPITTSRGTGADGLFVTVHEADLTDFASMTLTRDTAVPGRLVSDLIALPNGVRAVVDLDADGFDTPWRTLTIGRDAGDLAESHLIENLNDPCAVCDVDSDGDGIDDTADWIEPATYTGVWWELQRRATTWNAGPNHGATTARTKAYIDLAADAGAKFVLAEGWNTNSGGQWTNQDFTTPQADFDLPEVLAYAESKGVGFIAHNETRGFVDYYDQNLERIFSFYESQGIHAIKTGYATRFLLGGVNRSHYDQEAVRHYQRVVDAAARHQITVNAHEAIKPTGLNRTYPNMMTGEGVAGMEQQNYMGAQGNPPAQATILPFTRFMGGPADYTPGVLNVTWDPANLNTRVQTTLTAQLALYTTFYSPTNMLADTPENYALFPEAFDYLRDMPTTWDDSEVTAVIGDHTVTARRSGETWYVGAITDENDRTLTIPLDFLDPDIGYVAEVWSDAAGTTWKGDPLPVERTEFLATSATELRSSLVGGGGQALRLTPATAQEQAELAPYAAPEPVLVGTPRVSLDARNRVVLVDVTVRNEGSTVGAAALQIDGEAAAPARRVGAGDEATLSFRVPLETIPYPGPSTLAVGDGQGEPSQSVEVDLLPVPTAADRGTLTDLVAAGDLEGDAADAVAGYLDRSLNRAERGDFLGVQRGMQGLRLVVDSAAAGEVSEQAAAVVDEFTTPYLGPVGGVFSVLRAVRAVETDEASDPAVVSELRESAIAAAETAITGTDAAARAQLTALRERAAGLEQSAPVSELVSLLTDLVTTQTLEAEAQTLVGGAAVTTEHPGFTGTGFVRSLAREGAGIVFRPTAARALAYDIAFRYANGQLVQPLDRQLSLTVNDAPLTKVGFANTGQDADRWRRWTIAPAGVSDLVAGQNVITLGWRGNDTGNVNVDHLVLRASLGVIDDAAVRDLTAPALTTDLEPSTGRWTSAAVTATITATDAFDGSPEVSTRLDDGPWVVYDAPVRIAGDGLHTLLVRSSDASGNATAVVERQIGVDTVEPRLRFAYDERTRTVRVVASDETSGVSAREYRLGEGEWRRYTGAITLPGRSGATIEARATDRADNRTSTSLRIPAAVRSTVGVGIRTRNAPRGNDAVRVLAPDSVAGAAVRLYEVRGPRRVLLATQRADTGGTTMFAVADRTRDQRSYQARVGRTQFTRGAWTPVATIR